MALMHKAFDLGVTLFDAADTYGNGLSEELIANDWRAHAWILSHCRPEQFSKSRILQPAHPT
jgi:aryl-alcohol dehydrogenase-like predicted oxidoreductase